jgi:formylglycine-generating enzyme required for sulfatase activity
LLAKARQLGGRTPLLRSVGSFKPSGSEDPVFDLSGNVAEWTIAADGMGQASGGSADMPADSAIHKRKPASEYIGFRVVKGKAPGLTAK